MILDSPAAAAAQRPEDLSQEALAHLTVDMFHRIVVHYALWFKEAERRFGLDEALALLEAAGRRGYAIQMERLAQAFGFTVKDGVPAALTAMPREELLAALQGVCINWLANDGVWFQAVEKAHGMDAAKACNDAAWSCFSPFEARSIKTFLGLPERPGLAGLARALAFRAYARINVQTVIEEGPDRLLFQMNDCRVQSARKRRGLPDYPCKSGGVTEYATFAAAIDDRIRCECVVCPPDPHPEDWFCAWRFILEAR